MPPISTLYITLTAIHGFEIILLSILFFHGMRVFRALRKTIVFRKRRPRTVFVTFICFALAAFISGPMGYITATLFPDILVLIIISGILHQLFIVPAILLWLVLMWLYFYDARSARVETSKDWIKFLDPKQYKANWFLANRARWGNEMFCFRIIGVYWVLCTSGYIAVRSTGRLGLSQGIFGIQFTLPTIFILGLTAKTLNFRSEDFIGLYRQIQFCCVMGVLYVASSTTNFIIATMTTLGFEWRNFFLGLQTNLFIGVMTHALVISPRNYWQFELRLQEQEKSQRDRSRSQSVMHASLDHITHKMHSFEAFMNHLIREYSHENLLFVTEVSQFRALIKKHYPHQVAALEVEDTNQIPLPDEVPLSALIECYLPDVSRWVPKTSNRPGSGPGTPTSYLSSGGKTPSYDEEAKQSLSFSVMDLMVSPFYLIGKEIYVKYVSGSDMFELNVSFTTRSKLRQIFEHDWDLSSVELTRNRLASVSEGSPIRDVGVLDVPEEMLQNADFLFGVFNDAFSEITHTLLDSLSRFEE